MNLGTKLWLQIIQDQVQRWYGSVKAYFAHEPRGPEFIEVNRADQCVYCKGWHSRYCGRVHRIRFNERGDPAEVEYWNDEEWNHGNVIFLDEDHFNGEWVFITVKEEQN